MLVRLGEEFSGDQVAAANVRSAMGERWPFVKRSDVWPTTPNDSLVTISTLR